MDVIKWIVRPGTWHYAKRREFGPALSRSNKFGATGPLPPDVLNAMVFTAVAYYRY